MANFRHKKKELPYPAPYENIRRGSLPAKQGKGTFLLPKQELRATIADTGEECWLSLVEDTPTDEPTLIFEDRNYAP